MRRTHLLVTIFVVAGLAASLALTVGYAVWLRSDVVRAGYAGLLSQRLGLPCDIGAVVPRSWRSAEFRQVIVWLPERRDRALTCQKAWVRTLPDQAPAYEIIVEGGTCELSTRSWLRDDYRYVVDSGLRPGFTDFGPSRVSFANMDVVFKREGFRAKLHQAGGYVEFRDRQRGTASVLCRALNGHATPQPVLLTARFHPDADGVRFDQLELDVPEIPLDHLDLQPLTGREFCSGVFGGELSYAESDEGQELVVRGRCAGLELPDLTSGWLPATVEGRCPELTLEELRVIDQRPVSLRFRGRIEDLVVRDLLAALDLPAIDGRFSLEVSRADLVEDGVRDLVAAGRGRDLSLQTITEALGRGEVTGTLQVRIDDLAIVDNRLKSLRATITVDERNGPNWIESRLLTDLVERELGLDIGRLPLLPERIEYTKFGVRLEVRDEQLTVRGTHGPDGDTILTARLLGFEVPVIPTIEKTFDLTPLLDRARRTLSDVRRSK